jgi:hypothetical protein
MSKKKARLGERLFIMTKLSAVTDTEADHTPTADSGNISLEVHHAQHALNARDSPGTIIG